MLIASRAATEEYHNHENSDLNPGQGELMMSFSIFLAQNKPVVLHAKQ